MLEPPERCVHGAGGHVPPQPPLHFVENRPPVGFVAQPKNGKQYGLLEGSEDVRHVAYIVVFDGTESIGMARGPADAHEVQTFSLTLLREL